MITGKTESGFEFELPDDVVDDMELFDALVDLEKGDYSAASTVCRRLLGDQRQRLYDFLRRDGRVRVSDVAPAVLEILKAVREGKNS